MRTWPDEGVTRIPYWVYSDAEVYEREQRRVFGGPFWSYVALACEVAQPGDFVSTWIGEQPVVVVRQPDGSVRAFLNRCAHRGVAFCRSSSGHADELMCPYHQWVYDLAGNLVAAPFRKGVTGSGGHRMGGMPDDFELADHGLVALPVTERHGVVFASIGSPPPFDEYLGPTMLGWFDRVFDGRDLELLGYMRQRVPANWKLMFENIKDPYHASLLHVFLVTFGLFRADNPSATEMDETGRHSVLVSERGAAATEATGEMRAFRDVKLHDPRLLDPVREFPGSATVVMQTLWPNLIVQQQSNTLAMRQLVPRGPQQFDLMWTFFGYAGEDPEMRTRRLRQANLMGPSGLVSIDDSEVMRLAQLGATADPDGFAFVEMGGTDTERADHIVTESAIRAFYAYYREVMEL
jgi:salicylate 5-hydroxylase large subunit